MAKERKKDSLLGALDLLILRVLSTGPNHGYGIARRIEQISGSALVVQQGSLYPALHRLEKKGFVKSSLGQTEKGREAKFYELTKHGLERIDVEKRQWRDFVSAIDSVLEKG